MRMRKKKHLSERMDAVSSYLIDISENEMLNFKEIFKNDNPVHIEIGCGKGRFINGKSNQNPNINFIGLERVEDVLLLAMEKAALGEASNLKFMNCDAVILPDIIEEGALDAVYLNFSDPWPKSRHEKRRLTYKSFLSQYKYLLKNNAPLIIKTDNRPFFDFTVDSLKEFNADILEISYDLHNDKFNEGNIETEYEQRFSAMGVPINYCKAIL